MTDGVDPAIAIQLRGLTKSFGKVEVLKGMDLSVPTGSIFGFLGQNGAGKSTAMNIMAGLNQPGGGEVRIFGLDVSKYGVQTRSMLGLLRQDPRFYTWMTAHQTLTFTGKFFGMDSRDRDRRADDLLDLVELRDARDRKMGGFSGGMRQRLGVAQALMGNPQLVILDEPVSALDPQGRYEVIKIMERLRGTTTIFYSTHILQDVERVADQVAIVRDGTVALQGPLDQILHSNRNALVVEIEGDDQMLADALRHLPYVTAVDVEHTGVSDEKRRLTVTTTDLDRARRELPPMIVQYPVLFERCSPAVSSLEDIFLGITGANRQPGSSA